MKIHEIKSQLAYISELKKSMTLTKQTKFNKLANVYPFTRHKLVTSYILHVLNPNSKEYNSSREKLLLFLNKKRDTLIKLVQLMTLMTYTASRRQIGGFFSPEDENKIQLYLQNQLRLQGMSNNIVRKAESEKITAYKHFDLEEIRGIRRALRTHTDAYSTKKTDACADIECLVLAATKYEIYGKTNMKPGDKLYRTMCLTSIADVEAMETLLHKSSLGQITSFSPIADDKSFQDCNNPNSLSILQYIIILTLNTETKIFSDSVTIEHPKGLYLGKPGFEVQVMPGTHDIKYRHYRNADERNELLHLDYLNVWPAL